MDLEVAFIRLGEATRLEMQCAYGFVHHSASSETEASGSGGQRRQELRMGESTTMMRSQARFRGGWDDALLGGFGGRSSRLLDANPSGQVSSSVCAKKDSYSS